jgi:transposase
MAVVMIGVDPHKASHTAVAVGAGEEPLGQLRVRASAVQARRLLEWAQAWPERSWTCSPSWPPGSGCWPMRR